MILRQCDRKNADVMDFSERKRLYGGLLFLDRGQIGCSLKRRTPYSWIMDRNEMIGKRTNVLGTLSWPASFITGLLKYSSKTMRKIRFEAFNKVRQHFLSFNGFFHRCNRFWIQSRTCTFLNMFDSGKWGTWQIPPKKLFWLWLMEHESIWQKTISERPVHILLSRFYLDLDKISF